MNRNFLRWLAILNFRTLFFQSTKPQIKVQHREIMEYNEDWWPHPRTWYCDLYVPFFAWNDAHSLLLSVGRHIPSLPPFIVACICYVKNVPILES